MGTLLFTIAMLATPRAFLAIDSTFGPPRLIYEDEQRRNCIIGESDCDLRPLHERFIHVHNIERSAISGLDASTKPANMLEIEADETLQQSAQLYAEKCLQRSIDPNAELHCPPPAMSAFDGEVNVHVKTYDESEMPGSAMARVSKVVTDWAWTLRAYEIDKVPALLQSYQSSSKLHDCANALRATTWKAGCGIADFQITENSFTEVMICYYKNNKLRDGDEIYSIGEPCSLCPEGTGCVGETLSSYRNLCRVKKDSCPVTTNKYRLEDETCYIRVRRESGSIVFNCAAAKMTSECKPEMPCISHWEIDQKDHSKKLTASGYCTSVTLFKQDITIDKRGCFKFQYIIEPSGNSEQNITVSGFASPENDVVVSADANKEVNGWSVLNLDIPQHGTFQVGVIVHSESPLAAGQQVIKMREFTVTEGMCL